MSELGKGDPHLRPMIDELEWLGNLERLVNSRGGPEAPIRIYADEDGIERLIGGWNDETGEHQRALARIASHVDTDNRWSYQLHRPNDRFRVGIECLVRPRVVRRTIV